MNDATDLRGKVAVVTGASSGLGLMVATELARMGATIVTVSRNARYGEAARDEIARQSSNPAVEFIPSDLSSLQATREVAEEILSRHDTLHLLINNAGTMYSERKMTPEGFERTFATNYLSPFLFTNLLLDRIKASAPARVLNIVTGLHGDDSLDFDNLQGEKRYGGWEPYYQSKLALLLFTSELAHRLERTGVDVNCVHPGVFQTNFGKNMDDARTPDRSFKPAPDNVTERVVYLATSTEVEGVTGRFFGNPRDREPARESPNPSDQRRLWDLSAQLTINDSRQS